MTRDDITRHVIDGLRQVAPELDPTRLRADQPIAEALEIDSFDVLRFLTGLHRTFGIEIPEADYGRLRSVDDIVSYVQARIGSHRRTGSAEGSRP